MWCTTKLPKSGDGQRGHDVDACVRVCLGVTRSRFVSRPYRFPSTRWLGESVSLRRFYAAAYDHDFLSFPVSLPLSSPSLAASTSSFLHAAINLGQPSVTVSTHTSASNAVAFQSPAMPNARMSLCTQSLHFFSFPPYPQGKVPEHDSLWEESRPEIASCSRDSFVDFYYYYNVCMYLAPCNPLPPSELTQL